jgi:diguanylate cyclase (GGDEF)-like protein/PAS domain S-box-containing protein
VERALRQESEERFCELFEHAPFGIRVSGLDGRLIQVNAAFCRMLGYSELELLGTSWADLTHPDDLGLANLMKEQLWSGQLECVVAETRYLHRNGTVVWSRIKVSLVRNSEGNPLYSVLYVEDTTERKRSEDALRESEDRFRIMADGCPTLLWVTNAEGGNQFINREYQEFTGTTTEQAEGPKWQLLVHPDDAPIYVETFQRAVREHAPFRAEARVRRADGDWRWIDSYAEPRLSRSGEFLGHVGLSPDITERKQAENTRQEEEKRYRTQAHALQSAGECISITDTEDRILYVNDAFLSTYSYQKDELIGRNIDIVRGPRTSTGIEDEILPATLAGRWSGELLNRTKQGLIFPVALATSAVYDEDGRRIALVGIARDITARKLVEEALQSSEEKLRQLAENIHEVFWMMNAASTELIYVSPAYEKIWGQTCESIYSNPESWMLSIHPDDRAGAGETFRRQVRGEVLENEYRIVQPSGAIRWIRDRAFPIRDSVGNIVRLAGVAEDTTERKLAELRLVHQAQYDELTDLPNRTLFQERLKRAVDEKSGAVFFIDLDQFKSVNDTLGHLAGDQILKEAANRLLTVCGESDTLARFGGDEFMLLATSFEGPDSVRQLGHKLLKCLDEPFRIAGRELFIAASIGISLFPANGTRPDELKRDADFAMHEAKRAGKKQLRFFTPAFAEDARERMEMETRLRRAVALSEFKLAFQPQFAAGKSRPSRFEALIRWFPTDDQPMSPLKFIPIAEQNGLIVPIGTWVLREACRKCAGWQTGTLTGTGVAVNVSASQFACPDFMETVARTLKSTGLPAHLLELELTESVFIQDVKKSALTLTKLRNLGVTIALDDFGTGYSSLSYLQNLPLDALKIDRSFLTEAENRLKGAALLRCIIDLAHTLGLRVIGEGVETSAQLDRLRNLGCNEFQGFLLGRPSFDVFGDVKAETWNPSFPTAEVVFPEFPKYMGLVS